MDFSRNQRQPWNHAPFYLTDPHSLVWQSGFFPRIRQRSFGSYWIPHHWLIINMADNQPSLSLKFIEMGHSPLWIPPWLLWIIPLSSPTNSPDYPLITTWIPPWSHFPWQLLPARTPTISWPNVVTLQVLEEVMAHETPFAERRRGVAATAGWEPPGWKRWAAAAAAGGDGRVDGWMAFIASL